MNQPSAENEDTVKKLQHLNSVLKSLVSINQLIVRSSDPFVLVQQVCNILVENEGFKATWVALTDRKSKIYHVVQKGFDDSFSDFLRVLNRGTIPLCIKRAQEGNRIATIYSTEQKCAECPLKKFEDPGGALSVLISYKGRQFGWLTVSIDYTFIDSEDDRILLSEVSGDLGLALSTLENESVVKEIEERFSTLFNFSPDAIFVHPFKKTGFGKFIEVNKVACERYGYTREELLKLSPEDISSSNDVVLKENSKARNALEKEINRIFEVIHITKSGREFPVEVSSTVFTFGGKKVIMSVARDISERKKAEKILREGEERFRLAFHTSPDSVSLSRLEDGVYVDVNKGFTENTGYTRQEVIGKSSLEINIWADYKDRQKFVEILKEHGKVNNMEIRFRSKDGGIINGLISASVLSFNGVSHLITVGRNINDLKHAQEEIRKLSQAVEQNPLSIVITDSNGLIEYVNPSFIKVTGYSLKEALGRTPNFLKSGKTSEDVYENIWKTISNGKVWTGELVNRKKDGSFFWEKVIISPIFDTSNKITHYLGLKEDITSRKQLEEQLRHSQKMEAIGQLAGGVAHDFNNIITAINGYCDLILREIDRDNPVYNRVQQIEYAGDRAATLTRQLLAFSRKQLLNPEVINLNQLIQNLEKMLHRLIGEHIKFKTIYEENPGMIRADPGQIEQIIMNLVLNARDAMPDGGKLILETKSIRFTDEYVRWHRGTEPGWYVLLSVTDTGVGMDKEIQGHIFEPFFTTKKIGKGTGLGLSTVYGIVKQSGSTIRVYSEPEKGTTFKIYFPVSGEKIPDKYRNVKKRGKLEGNETILIVEDEKMILDLTAEGLRGFGYSVMTASDKISALTLLRNDTAVDLLLTDLIMPGGSGVELAKELQDKFPSAKILLMSGYSLGGIQGSDFLSEGMNFIQKPFSIIDLTEKIRSILDTL